MFSGPFNRIIDAVANIAQKLGATVNSTGNRLADNLDGIANVVTPGGGGSGALVVNVIVDGENLTLDKTWQEIYDAMPLVVVTIMESPYDVVANLVGTVSQYGGDYIVDAGSVYITDSASGYPTSGGK